MWTGIWNGKSYSYIGQLGNDEEGIGGEFWRVEELETHLEDPLLVHGVEEGVEVLDEAQVEGQLDGRERDFGGVLGDGGEAVLQDIDVVPLDEVVVQSRLLAQRDQHVDEGDLVVAVALLSHGVTCNGNSASPHLQVSRQHLVQLAPEQLAQSAHQLACLLPPLSLRLALLEEHLRERPRLSLEALQFLL